MKDAQRSAQHSLRIFTISDCINNKIAQLVLRAPMLHIAIDLRLFIGPLVQGVWDARCNRALTPPYRANF